MIRVAAIVILLPSLAAAQTLTARQCEAILNSVSEVVCLGNQCFRLPVSPPTTGAQVAAGDGTAATTAPAAFEKPTLFYFTQANCAPCRRVEALQRDANVAKWLRNGYQFQTVDLRTTNGRALAIIYGVTATPTHVAVQGTKEIARWGYVQSPADYARKMDAAWRAAGGKR
jgi:hypothetical protein